MRMLGRQNKPFCYDCCCPYRQGSGNKNKRLLVKINKRKENQEWKKEVRKL